MTKRTIAIFILTLFCLVGYCQTKPSSINLSLKHKLDSVLVDDQKYRVILDLIQSNSKKSSDQKNLEIEYINEQIKKQDKLNLSIVTLIIDEYGWIGPEVIGENANSTLFLVIQHSDQITQEKYLPIMRKAVKDGKAQPSSLALLEDRVALGQGKKQIYGSQIMMNARTGMEISPIEGEINVNKRRKAVGLEPIEEYAKYFGITYKLSQSNEEISDEGFIKRHSIVLSIVLIITFYSIIFFLLFKYHNAKWFYLLLIYFLLFIISSFFDYTNAHSLLKEYEGNWMLFIFFPILFHTAIIYIINYSFSKLFNVKSVFIEITSIFISSILYVFVINEKVQIIFIPDSGIMFFKNLVEPAFYSSILLVITYILYLISKRKARRRMLVE